jgi:hypothetical protein
MGSRANGFGLGWCVGLGRGDKPRVVTCDGQTWDVGAICEDVDCRYGSGELRLELAGRREMWCVVPTRRG